MITSVHIQGFRSCEDVRLDSLGHLVAIVGRNGAGKTNVLEAIDWACRTATRSDPLSPGHTLVSHGTTVRVSLEWQEAGQAFRYAIDYELRLHEKSAIHLIERLDHFDGTTWHETLTRSGARVSLGNKVLNIGTATPCLPVVAAFVPGTDAIATQVQAAISFLQRVRYYPIDELNEPSEESFFVGKDEFDSWCAAQKPGAAATKSVLRRLLYLYHRDRPRFDELKSLLGEDGLGIVHAIEVQELTASSGSEADSFYIVRYRPMPESNSLYYPNLSSGTRRLISILVALAFDNCSVMLLEQPEDGIHSGLTKKLADILRHSAGQLQLMVSSHSPNVINRLKPDEVRLVAIDEKGHTRVRRLTDQEIGSASEYLSDDRPLEDFLLLLDEDA